MNSKIVIIALAFCLAVAVAYPAEYAEFEESSLDEDRAPSNYELHRAKRQFNMQGGGSRGQGFDVNANAKFPIWENGRNSVHGTAGYSQHLGGPYGNSNPDYRGGVIFEHRF